MTLSATRASPPHGPLRREHPPPFSRAIPSTRSTPHCAPAWPPEIGPSPPPSGCVAQSGDGGRSPLRRCRIRSCRRGHGYLLTPPCRRPLCPPPSQTPPRCVRLFPRFRRWGPYAARPRSCPMAGIFARACAPPFSFATPADAGSGELLYLSGGAVLAGLPRLDLRGGDRTRRVGLAGCGLTFRPRPSATLISSSSCNLGSPTATAMASPISCAPPSGSIPAVLPIRMGTGYPIFSKSSLEQRPPTSSIPTFRRFRPAIPVSPAVPRATGVNDLSQFELAVTPFSTTASPDSLRARAQPRRRIRSAACRHPHRCA